MFVGIEMDACFDDLAPIGQIWSCITIIVSFNANACAAALRCLCGGLVLLVRRLCVACAAAQCCLCGGAKVERRDCVSS